MAAEDTIFDTSTVKYTGIFSFSDFYAFCYGWIMSEIEPNEFGESGYSEKTPPAGKEIDITWTFRKKFTNYIAFTGTVIFKTIKMKTIEIEENGEKVKKNQGEVVLKLKGNIVTDYLNHFDNSEALQKWRGIYNKWIIKSRVDKFEGRIDDFCTRFMNDAKAFLETEGKR